ncbi:MAG: hypothetical protein HYR56_30025 [Acidobacteria bacterium]|nr:hypothetical protein [Acidobacteriota bacterium]MBI3427732.1 hypothetical protein [Acidobacteriota bacterium]
MGTYDPAQATGLVLGLASRQADEQRPQWQGFFGVRLLVYRQGAAVEDAPPLERIALFGPQASEGRYGRLHWELPFERKLATLQWTRTGPRTVLGRFTAQAPVRVALETYQPFPRLSEGGRVNFRVQDVRTILGEQVGKLNAKPLRMLLRAEREASGAAAYNDAAALRDTLSKEGRALPIQTEGNAAFGVQRFGALSFELKEQEPLGFVIVLGEDVAALEREAAQALHEPAAKTLEQAEIRYGAARPRSTGWLADALEALSRAVNWNRLFVPELRSEFASAWRADAPQPKQVSMHWDAFMRALTAALIDPPQAQATVRAMLDRLGSDGRLSPASFPVNSQLNAEATVSSGRSMPPVGALSAWKIYLATQDVTFLTAVYPRLKRWHEWWRADRGDGQPWRDGNGDGLLEWGYDAELEVGESGAQQMPAVLKQQYAAAESGWDDSPQWQPDDRSTAVTPKLAAPFFNEKSHTLEMTPVGLNALYALDTELLFLMARELGLKDDTAKWEVEYARLKQLFDLRLWSDDAKLYLNRRWNGQFAQHATPESLFALAAGIPSRERAAQLVEALRDPQRFGGEPLLPTLARADAAFSQAGRWRGRVSALTHYLVYLGLKRYGFYAEASELARQSTQLMREAWWRDAKTRDSFESAAPENANVISPVSPPPATWFGGLFWLPGLEELLTLDPWAGLTIGNEAVSAEARLSNLSVGGDLYDVALAPDRLAIQRNGQADLELDAPARLYNYRSTERLLNFYSEARKPLEVRVPPSADREISASVDGKLVGSSQPGKAARFKLTPGVHRVVIVR